MPEFLTIDAILANRTFETALTAPLPPEPAYELLDEARYAIDLYMTQVLESGAPREERAKALARAFDRLLDISDEWQGAVEREDAAIAAAQKAKEDAHPVPDFEPPGEVEHDETILTKTLFLIEGLVDHIGSVMGGAGCDTKDEERLFVLLLVRRCLAELITSRRGTAYRLSTNAEADLDTLLDEFEEPEPGFGPLEAGDADGKQADQAAAIKAVSIAFKS